MPECIVQGAAAQLWLDLLRQSEARLGRRLDEDTEAYLVFALLRHCQDASMLRRIVALEYLEAFEATGMRRVEALRDVGDRCLLLSGLFPRLAERRRVSLRYYLDIGQGAYAAVGELARRIYGDLFERLAGGFEGMVRVLSGVRVDASPLALCQAVSDRAIDSSASQH